MYYACFIECVYGFLEWNRGDASWDGRDAGHFLWRRCLSTAGHAPGAGASKQKLPDPSVQAEEGWEEETALCRKWPSGWRVVEESGARPEGEFLKRFIWGVESGCVFTNCQCFTLSRLRRMCLCACTMSWRMWRRKGLKQKMRMRSWGSSWLRWRSPNRLYRTRWRDPKRWGLGWMYMLLLLTGIYFNITDLFLNIRRSK